MWEQIQLICPTAQPTDMIMDFELAAINSLELESYECERMFLSPNPKRMAQDPRGWSTGRLYAR